PITSGTFARPSASTAWAAALGGESHGPLGFMASTEDRLTQMAARMEMMNETMLDRVRWTSELVFQDALGKENVAGMVEELRQMVVSEHESLVADLAKERRQIFAELEAQRASLFRDLARERAAIFSSVASERATITSQASDLL